MKHIVSYSGGVGSAITAQMLCERHGADNVLLLFADTLIEAPDLYRFNEDVVRLLGVELITIQDGRTPWEVFSDEKYQGNTRKDPCSKVLKRELIKRWLRDNYEVDECFVYVGIDCTEEHRLPNVVSRNKHKYRSILVENDVFVDKADKINWCIDNRILPPELYTIGLAHNNCNGMCVKAGLGHYKILWEKKPEVYALHEASQEKLHAENPKLNKPFLRKRIAGKLEYLSLKRYRVEFLEKDGVTDGEAVEFGGCGCAL